MRVAAPGDGGDNPCAPTPPPVDTIVKKSLAEKPKVNCIYLNLVNNAVFKNLINAFVNNSNFNLTFNVGKLTNPNSRGETSTRSDYNDPNVEITINIDKIDDMSAVSMAEVFIHEVYHAYIDQILIQHNILTKAGFNNTFDNDFDRYVAFEVDSTQQVYRAQGISEFDPRWTQIQHEVMANDIDKMAKGLQIFVEQIYPNAKTDPDISFLNYQAYMWQGLINSQAFTTKWGDISNQTYNAKKNLLNTIPNPCNP